MCAGGRTQKKILCLFASLSLQHRFLCNVMAWWPWFAATGPAKKTKIQDAETNKLTAYHEAGHTLVAYFTKDAIPLHKVTIIPRGMSLGHVSLHWLPFLDLTIPLFGGGGGYPVSKVLWHTSRSTYSDAVVLFSFEAMQTVHLATGSYGPVKCTRLPQDD